MALNLLYVDDEPLLLDLTKTFLEREGDFFVDTVVSAEQALKKITTGSYDAIISDYEMPDMNGIDLLKNVRKQGIETPFLIFTGKGREDVVIDAINNGADFYIQKGGKPKAQFAELTHKIRQAYAHKYAKSALRHRELALSLATASTLKEAVNLCLNQATEIPGIDNCSLFLIDRNSEKLRYVQSRGMQDHSIEILSNIEIRPDESDLLEKSSNLFIEDHNFDKIPEYKTICENEGVVSVVILPFSHMGRIIGTLLVTSHTDSKIPASSRNELETIAAQGGNAIARLQAEEALCASEMLYRSTIDTMDAYINVISPDLKIQLINYSFQKWGSAHGIDMDNSIGKYLFDLFPFLPENVSDEYSHVISTQKPLVTEKISSISGTEIITETKKIPIIEDGTVTKVITVIRDITGHKRKEEKLLVTQFSVDHSKDSVFWTLPDGKFLYVNEAACTELGYSRKDLLSMNFTDIDPDYLPEKRDDYWDHLKKVNSFTFESVHRKKDGTEIPVEVSANYLNYKGSEYEITSSRNITERKNAEKELKESELYQKTILEAIQTGVIIISADTHTIVDINDVALGMLKATRDDVIGDVCHRWICPAEIGRCPVTDLGEEMDNSERVLINSKGKEIPIIKTVTPVTLHGKIHLLETFVDISERKRAEAALKEANTKLNLLSSVTRHDIINQVTGASGVLQLIEKNTQDNEKIQKYILMGRDILKNIEEQITFTRDYQNMGVKKPEWQRVDLLVSKLSTETHYSGIEFQVNTGNVELFADSLLEKVFTNLFDNTVRHGKSADKITISFHEDDETGILIVKDNGAGIPDNMKNAIFESGIGDNTGYGLFLAKEILGITGISIRENGVEGEGARFEITIPSVSYRISKNS